MKILISLLFCLLSGAGAAYAQFDGNPEVPVLVQNADTICVVRVAAITNIVPTQFEAVHHGRNGLPVFIDAQSAVAEAVVQNVLSGNISQKSIQIAFFKNVRHGFNPAPFTELAAGETDIVFLKATTDGTRFALSQPTSHGKSNITIGDTKIGPLPPNTSPLRAVLLALVDGVDSGSKAVKLECLNRIGSVGYLLNVKTGVYEDEGAVAVRAKLGEPLIAVNASLSLEQFVNDQVLPSVLKLTTDKDNELREYAIFTAAHLQDVTIIPALVQIADANDKLGEFGEAASALGQYRTPEAARPLILIMNNSNAHVRYSAINALRELNDPLALPFLLEKLDDKASEVKDIAIQALFTITGEVGSHLPPGDADSLQARELTFWKKWAAEHQDKIKALCAQFNAASPVPAVP